MDKRLMTLLQNRGGQIKDGCMIDTYNQQIQYDVSCTIRTNINTANHHFIVELCDTKENTSTLTKVSIGAIQSDSSEDNLVAEPLRIPQATAQGYMDVEPGSLFDGSYPNSKTRRGRVQDNGQSSPTLTANGEPPSYYEGVKEMRYRIRKLTPRECFRLMDVDENVIDTIQAAGISNSQQYKLAGNSIVVACLEKIFEQMFFPQYTNSRTLFG